MIEYIGPQAGCLCINAPRVELVLAEMIRYPSGGSRFQSEHSTLEVGDVRRIGWRRWWWITTHIGPGCHYSVQSGVARSHNKASRHAWPLTGF